MTVRKALLACAGVSLVLSFGLFAGCGDDDGGEGAVCGNDVIEGSEECDGTDLGGNDCTTIGQGFTGGELACTDYCMFDTSGCTTDTECGNGVIDPGEECDGTDLGGNDCTDVGNFTGGTLGCTDTCTYDTSQCEVSEDCGNGVIDAGEECDGTDLGGNDCTDVGDFTGGTLDCAVDCTFDTTECVSGQTASEQIAEARNTADGTVNLPIEGAFVTYIKPQFGNDLAGFTIQAEQLGPALFIAVDPTTLTPEPAVGDEVTFDIVELDTLYEQRRAIQIANFAVDSSGNDVSGLVQDVSDATDLVSSLPDYSTELIAATVTVQTETGFAGTGYLSAEVDTTAVSGNADLLLRVPEQLDDLLNLQPTCVAEIIGTPLWRFNQQAQISAWTTADIVLTSCPAPQVVSAIATADDTVVVSFNRAMDPNNVADTDFSFDQGLTASAVTVDGTQVIVTTSTQSVGTVYTVTVADTALDIAGGGVDQAANTADFAAFGSGELDCNDGLDNDNDGFVDCLDANCAGTGACAFGANLIIWEVDADQTSQDTGEFIEIYNNSGAAIDFGTQKYFVLFVNGSDDLLYDAYQLTGTLAAGEVYVLGNTGVTGVDLTFSGNSLQNGADGVLLVHCNACTDVATDFGNDLDPTTAMTFTTDGGATATKVDGVAYDTNDSDDTALWDVLGVAAQWNEDMNGNKDTESLQRISPEMWMAMPPTPDVNPAE
jgi:hypothetical protein